LPIDHLLLQHKKNTFYNIVDKLIKLALKLFYLGMIFVILIFTNLNPILLMQAKISVSHIQF
jgi:hypothetical protein